MTETTSSAPARQGKTRGRAAATKAAGRGGRRGPRGSTPAKIARAKVLLAENPALSADAVNETIKAEFHSMLSPRYVTEVKQGLGIKVRRGRQGAAKKAAPRPRGRPKGSSNKAVRTASEFPSHIIALLKGRKLVTYSCNSRKDAEQRVIRLLGKGADEKSLRYFSASQLSIKQVVTVRI